MTTHAQGPPAPRHAPGKFIQVSHDQLAMPMAGRGASHDGDRVSRLQKLVLFGLERLSWGGKKPCFATNLQIADAIGLTGGTDTLRTQVRIALHGRTYRKGRWDPDTGKWKRDGEKVTIPGLCDPSLGFVEVRQADPAAPRELVLTSRWLEWGRIRVFQDGNGEATGAGPAPAIATVSIDRLAGDEEPTAPVGPPSHVVPETAGTGTYVNPSGGTIATTSHVATETIEAPTGETATAPTSRPSPEALAEVLGPHFVHRSRQDQASRFVQTLLNRTVLLHLLDNGLIKPEYGAGADLLSPEEIAVLRWLKPELVELLKADAEKARPRPKPGEPAAGEKPAPKVVNPAEIRAMIARLTSQPADDDSDCRTLARRLVTDPGFAHNDADPPKSEATFFGLAYGTKRGVLPQVVMAEAFEAACGRKARNRGSVLVSEVMRIKAGMREPAHH